MIWFSRRTFLVMLVPAVFGCSSAAKVELVFDHDAYVYSENGAKQLRKKDEKFQWDGDAPMLIEAPGRSSLLLVSPKSNRPVKVLLPKKGGSKDDLTPSPDSSGVTRDKNTDKVSSSNFDLDYLSVARIIDKINQINTLMQDGDVTTAITLIDALRAEFSKLKYLNFVKASALYLKADYRGAKVLLEEALVDFPDHKDGKALLNTVKAKLGGG